MIETVLFKVLDSALLETDVAVYGGLKAIFTAGLPEDAPLPAILITAVGGRDWGCRDTKGGELRMDVQIFANKLESDQALRDLTWKVYVLLNRHTLLPHITNAGYTNVGCTASPPQRSNDEFGFPGFTIPLTVRVAKG